MKKEILIIDNETAQGLAYGDFDDSIWKVIENQIISTSRWNGHYDLIVQRLSDGKFFKSWYTKGLTESQDNDPYEYGEAKFKEVFPIEKTIIVYE